MNTEIFVEILKVNFMKLGSPFLFLLCLCGTLRSQDQYTIGIRGSINSSSIRDSKEGLGRKYGIYATIWQTPKLAIDLGISLSYFHLRNVVYYTDQKFNCVEFPVLLKYFPSGWGGFNVEVGAVASKLTSAGFRPGQYSERVNNKGRLVSPIYRLVFGAGYVFKRPSSWISVEGMYEQGFNQLYVHDIKGTLGVVGIQIGYALWITSAKSAQ